MLEKIKQYPPKESYFLQNRWDNPLHSSQATDQQGCLWPSSDDFYHPLNTMFSCFFTDEKHLKVFDTVLLRDGLHMLVEFYMRFPTPKTCRTTFYVPADLYFLVPHAWRAQTFAYRMNSPRPHKLQKNLLFYGLISETALNWNRLKFLFADWLKQFPVDANVCAHFAIRNEPYNHKWEDRNISFEVMGTLQHRFKQPVDVMTYPEFIKQGVRSDMTYINLDLYHNGVGLCAIDNTFMGQAIDIYPRGVYADFCGKEIGQWPLSFNHKLTIYEGDCPHEDFTQFLFMRKMNAYPYTPKLVDLVVSRLKSSWLV